MSTHIDLFTGIGGFSLACQWNGIQTEVMVEKDEKCRGFLRRTYPDIPIIPDVREFDGTKWRGRFILTGGVPCQPASRAGKQRGKEDDRWLWPEAIRVLAEAKPCWALFENPPGIYDVGFDGILSDLESTGYEVGICEIPACAVNSPQIRQRVWIVAHSNECQHRGWGGQGTEEDGIQEVNRPSIRSGVPCGAGQGGLAKSCESGTGDHRETPCDERGQPVDTRAEGLRCGDGEACTDGIDATGQSHMSDTGNKGHQNVQLGKSFRKMWRSTHDPTSECAEISSQSHLADTSSGKHSVNTPEQEGRDKVRGYCSKGDMADTGQKFSLQGINNPTESERRGSCNGDKQLLPSPGFWSNSVWLPCADGKLRRAPDDSFGVVNGLPVNVFEELAEEGWPHRSVLAGLGNSIVPQVAFEIIKAIICTEI